MGNDPALEIVAKKRSELTDRIAKEVIRNFGNYNAAKYMKIAKLNTPHSDGYRKLILNVNGKNKKEIEVYGKDQIPAKLLDVDFVKSPDVMGIMKYASIHIYTSISAKEEPSMSQEFPYTVVSFMMDPVMDDTKGIAKVACGPALELIAFDGLGLTARQQKQFRIVPYWEGPAYVNFNHFTYDQFRKLGMKGLTEAFLYANEHSE